jgi:phosphoglucosamine mutase
MRDTGVLNALALVEKELGDGGRVLLRKSGTEPVIRIMVEAEGIDECNRHIGAIEDAIRKGGFCL